MVGKEGMATGRESTLVRAGSWLIIFSSVQRDRTVGGTREKALKFYQSDSLLLEDSTILRPHTSLRATSHLKDHALEAEVAVL